MLSEDGLSNTQKRGLSPKRKLGLILAAIGIAVAVAASAAFAISVSERFESYVSYDYTVAVSSNASDEFTVLCPFPANGTGQIATEALHMLKTIGNATVTSVATEHGAALKIVGTGLVVVEFSSRSELPGLWEGYKDFFDLSLVEGSAPYGAEAHIYSDVANILFDLRFDYNSVFGQVGADFITYRIVSPLEAGWNMVDVDTNHLVA